MGPLHPTGDSLYPRNSLIICEIRVIRGFQLLNLGSLACALGDSAPPGGENLKFQISNLEWSTRVATLPPLVAAWERAELGSESGGAMRPKRPNEENLEGE